jgi:histidinol-phosphate aminotransferase
MSFRPPSPRRAVADPALSRPDWTAQAPRDPALLWLDRNENSDPDHQAVVREVLAALPAAAPWTYPDNGPVYKKLAAHLGLAADQVILTAGSDGAIRAAFEAFVEPGNRVVHTAPTFAMYSVYARMYGADARAVEYRPSNDGPRLTVDDLETAIAEKAPKLVCLPNPDSPTGTVFAPAEMRRIIEAAGRAGALMLVDEAYYPFHPETCLPWIAEYPHLMVTRSTGKAWGLAGFRVGFAAAAVPVARLLHKVRPMYEVNTLAVHALDAMLDRYDDVLASVRRLEAGKAWFLAEMERLGFRTLEGRGNFCHVAFGARAEKVHAALADLVYYRRDFAEPCLKGFSRFSVTTRDRFRPVVDAIAAATAAP